MVTPKLGLSMLYCLGEPFQKMTKRLTSIEIEYVEIVDDGFHELNKQRISVLNEIGASHSLKYSVHAPFADVNIASPSRSLLGAMIKRLERSIVYARALDAYLWVFHPGTKTGISMFKPSMDWVQNLKTAETLAKIADKHGVTVAIENVPEPYPFLMKSVDDFKGFYAKVHENIGLVLDVGHSNVSGQTESFLKAFPDKIVHMHWSDNDGRSDQHLGIGHGTVEWARIASLIKEKPYDKTIIIESIENVEESLQRLKRLFI
jgi:sugar phosphate isomerase/epimerase